jgi:hypothetical protein
VMLEFISEYYGGTEVGIETAKRMEYRWEREKEASYFLCQDRGVFHPQNLRHVHRV